MKENRDALLAELLAERLPAVDELEREAARYPQHRGRRLPESVPDTPEARRELLLTALDGPTRRPRRLPRQRSIGG